MRNLTNTIPCESTQSFNLGETEFLEEESLNQSLSCKCKAHRDALPWRKGVMGSFRSTSIFCFPKKTRPLEVSKFA